MVRELIYLHDIKGDMNRLGYMKIISSFLYPNNNIGSFNLAESLHTSCTTNGTPRWEAEMELAETQNGLSKTMMIPKGTANSYVEFANILEIYTSIESASLLNGKLLAEILDLDINADFLTIQNNPLILEPIEKFFFWHLFIQNDGAVLYILMRYIIQKNDNCTRKELMNHLMETPDGYELILTTELQNPNTSYDDQIKLQEKLQHVPNFTQNRIDLENDGTWNVTEQYSLYRHFADPRIQWLIDLGFLRKNGRTNLSATQIAQDLLAIMDNYIQNETLNLFHELALLFFPRATNATNTEIINEIIVMYDRLTIPTGAITVVRQLLCLAVSFSLIKNNKLVTPEQVNDQIENMLSRFQNFAYTAVDYDNNPIYLHMETNEIRNNLT